MALSPYLGYLIVQSQFDGALGVLGIAAVTDLVSQKNYIKFNQKNN